MQLNLPYFNLDLHTPLTDPVRSFDARITLPNHTFFFKASQKQRLYGVISNCLDEPPEKFMHYIFMDFDETPLPRLIRKTLIPVQVEFRIGDIFILSDKEGSYRAISWSKRPWMTYLHILHHCYPPLDYNFFAWTIRRGAATLRDSNKADRMKQKIVQVLRGYEPTSFPSKIGHCMYDTGVEKIVNIKRLGDVMEIGFSKV